MKPRIELHPEARKEYLAAVSWYRRRDPLVAKNFQSEFIQATQRIAANPEQWPIGDAATRRVLMHRFPYLVYYEATSERILILAVAHQKQRPGYWSRRKK